MSFKIKLFKTVLNKTPKRFARWAVNRKTKGIAELLDFNIQLDERKVYSKVLLAGEDVPIEVWIEDFVLIGDEAQTYLQVQRVQSNKVWLDTLLDRTLLSRNWPIPDSQVAMLRELLGEPI